MWIHEFMKTYNFKLADKESRFFDHSYSTDTSAILINRLPFGSMALKILTSTIILEPTIDG